MAQSKGTKRQREQEGEAEGVIVLATLTTEPPTGHVEEFIVRSGESLFAVFWSLHNQEQPVTVVECWPAPTVDDILEFAEFRQRVTNGGKSGHTTIR